MVMIHSGVHVMNAGNVSAGENKEYRKSEQLPRKQR